MRLATNRRAQNPPPVPPKPSRRMLAETLKSSQRPPPNARCWRSVEDREEANDGRTVVYESGKEERTMDEATTLSRATSEMNYSENERDDDDSANEKKLAISAKEEKMIIDEARKLARRCSSPTKMEKNRKVEKSSSNTITIIDEVISVRDANEEALGRRKTDDSEKDAATSTTISSDDLAAAAAAATIVVIDESECKIAFEDNDNIHHRDWLEAGVRYSSTKITLPGDERIDRADQFPRFDDYRRTNVHDDYDDDAQGLPCAVLDFSRVRERIAMSSLQGLPPLPRSLSGFNLSEGRREAGEPPPPPPARSSSKTQKDVKSTQPSGCSRPSPPGRQLTTLDTQLAVLRKEMFGLRQLDLSLLSQLWSLNESIQEFRQLVQEQEDRAPSPSPSSEEGDDTSYGSHPPPPPRRPAPLPLLLQHHHRPPRPPRPLRPQVATAASAASDESPSSEEYGAV